MSKNMNPSPDPTPLVSRKKHKAKDTDWRTISFTLASALMSLDLSFGRAQPPEIQQTIDDALKSYEGAV